MNLTVGEIREATKGRVLWGDPKQVVRKICTDTRLLREGETFLALRGPNFKGDDFVDQAVSQGAQGIISMSATMKPDMREDSFFLEVDDTLTALGDIAREWRRVVDPTVVALTGSAGKTTTKEMLAYICRGEFEMLATEGNYNNRVGLPLTLLRLREEHELAIVETGMNMAGELTELARISIPDISVITNVGNAHIGNFGTQEKLIAAKAELFEASPRDATAVINADCPHCSIMAEAFRIPEMVITYGQNKKADVQAKNVRLAEPYGYEFDLQILEEVLPVHLKVYGRFQVSNALAAIAAAATLGVSPETIADKLCRFNAPEMRGHTEWFDGIFMISDCYNASPDATISSLQSLNDVAGINRRFAVLGDMAELGEHSERFHRIVGAAVAEAHIDYLCTIGEYSEYIREEAEKSGIAAKQFDSAEEIAEFLNRKLGPSDGMIIKGSRMLKLEQVLLRLKELRSMVQQGEAVDTLGEAP